MDRRTLGARPSGVPLPVRTLLAAACLAITPMALAQTLPPVPFPAENPFSEAKRVLGKALFFEEQLSSDNTVACATCHVHRVAGTDPRRAPHPGVDGVFQTPDDVFGSPGVIRQDAADDYLIDAIFGAQARVTNRASMSVINAAYTPLAFWDGRAASRFTDPETGAVAISAGGALESQIVGPPVNDVEMAHQARSWSQITARLQNATPLALATNIPPDVADALRANPSYPQLFTQAFGDGAITGRRIAFAIATYERTLISDQTDWDAFQAGNPNAMNQQERRGFQVFQTRNCAVCHTPPLFTGNTFRNIGLRPPGDDPGRQGVTGVPNDARRFKVPTVRNAALKTSFTHTGQFTALPQIVGFYSNAGIQFPQNRDPLLPIPLNAQDRQDLVAFIAGALVDPRVAAGTFPFDAPTLFSQRPNTSLVQTGNGLAGTGGQVPQWIAVTPPNLGNEGFKVGVRAPITPAPAWLRVSASPPVNDVVAPDEVVGPVTLGASAGPLPGYATAHWPVPSEPAYAGATMYMQWIVADPNAAGGMSRSRPLIVTILGVAPTCRADFNADGAVNSQDFFGFLGAFFAQDNAADFDASGAVTSADFFAFLGVFFSGC
jgi:cytochrome c peroxidase